MSVISPVEGPAQADRRPRADGWRLPAWLILCGYLLVAVVLTWQLWADPAHRAQVLGTSIGKDPFDQAWFMRYAATAVSHGRLPALFTKALNAPQGINLMWNTGMLLPGVLLAPVTLLAGPQVSLTILLTLGFAGSAASMFWVLRRWGTGYAAAAVGGALYGFGPALRVAAESHYFLEFAVLPPLIVDAVLRLATGRGHGIRTGIWLGLLIWAQLFISEELLADTAVACAIVVVALAACRPAEVLERARAALPGLATAAAVMLVLCAYPLWVEFHGPLAEWGTPWNPAQFGNRPVDFVTAPSGMLFQPQNFQHFMTVTHQSWAETLSYLGWPLLVALAAAAIFFWRDLRVRIAAVTFAVLEIFGVGQNAVTIGGFRYPAKLLPWYYLHHLPLIGEILPNRLAIVADGAAAAVLAFALNRAAETARTGRRWPVYTAAAITAVALVPVIPVPLATASIVPPPPGWQAAFGRLRPAADAPVLIVPANSAQTMDWQAASGQPGSMVGGYCLAPRPSGKAAYCDHLGTRSNLRVINALNDVQAGEPNSLLPTARALRRTLKSLKAADFVAVTSSTSRLGRFLISVLGRPTVENGSVMGWRLKRR